MNTIPTPSKQLANGFSIPVLGFGTWRMGGDANRDPQNDDQRDIDAIRSAIENGFTHIDTAEMYAEGFAEKFVGEAISSYDRSNLFIASKVWSDHLGHDDVKSACKKSLERLGTDYLDLYYIHFPNNDIPIQETMRGLNELVDEHLIGAIGVSNFTVPRMQEAQRHSSYPIVANQVHYNLMIREVEVKGLLTHCQQNDVFLVAWRPLQPGNLRGGSKSSQFSEKGKYPILDELSQQYGKTNVQIALNWLLSQKNVTALIKTTNPDHLKENRGALGWSLADADIERLKQDFPHQLQESDRVPLA